MLLFCSPFLFTLTLYLSHDLIFGHYVSNFILLKVIWRLFLNMISYEILGIYMKHNLELFLSFIFVLCFSMPKKWVILCSLLFCEVILFSQKAKRNEMFKNLIAQLNIYTKDSFSIILIKSCCEDLFWYLWLNLKVGRVPPYSKDVTM